MVENRKPIWIKEATEMVMHFKKRGSFEKVSLDDCDGRFLAQPLKADHDVPPFNRSPYDGFALRASDTIGASRENPLTFEVVDEIGAGSVSHYELGSMESIRIMTGAQIPQNADCVIMLELVQEKKHSNGRQYIVLKRPLQKGDNISFQGEDAKLGTSLIKQGEKINPGVKALLATFGYPEVPCVKPPLVGIITTGSELLRPEEDLVPGKIRNSNGYMIEAQIVRAGGLYKRYGSVSDQFKDLLSIVKKAMTECDIVITTGGVSVGDYDYMPKVYQSLGAELLFNKIAMRPGSVTSCAQKDGKLFFGLSGNPSACYIGFELYVRPYIRYWLYSSKPYLKKITGKLKSDFPKANPFSRFVRCKLSIENGHVYANPVGLDKSGVVTSLAWADCLAVLPGGTKGFAVEDSVEILMLEDQEGSEDPWIESRFSKL